MENFKHTQGESEEPSKRPRTPHPAAAVTKSRLRTRLSSVHPPNATTMLPPPCSFKAKCRHHVILPINTLMRTYLFDETSIPLTMITSYRQIRNQCSDFPVVFSILWLLHFNQRYAAWSSWTSKDESLVLSIVYYCSEYPWWSLTHHMHCLYSTLVTQGPFGCPLSRNA